MRRKQNVIVFSAGESVRNGNVSYIQRKLEEREIACFDWRALFSQAHNMEQIALLPSLSKKIPTFDFALIFAEAVDTVRFRGDCEQDAMRDNVIFELGLCVMALGIERVILLAEESIRIPEDLVEVGKIGIEYVTFDSFKKDSSIDKVGEIIEQKADAFSERFTSQLDRIIEYINTNSDLISPVFIGAAVSSAEAYYLNFIIRLLENTDNGFSPKNNPDMTYNFPERFAIKIIIPTSVDLLSRQAISEFYSKNQVDEFVIHQAGARGLFFNGIFDEQNGLLTIIDIPTSITASYAVVNSVLNMDSDDEYDCLAEERFVTKEMDIYAFALNKLLVREVAAKRLSFIKNEDKKAKIIRQLENVSIAIEDISDFSRKENVQ